MISEVLTLRALRGLSPEEAAATLQLRRTEQPNSVPDQLIDSWLSQDTAHVRAWNLAQRVDAALNTAADNELLDAMRRHARAQTARRPPTIARVAASAAAVIVCLGVVSLLVVGRHAPSGFEAQPSNGIYAAGGASVFKTKPDQEKEFSLADGSRLMLDGDSVVTVAFEKDRRRLRLLKGRAFFEVAHQATRPFSVTAGDREVTALGTQFDVRLRQKEVRVVLVEGRLSVAQAGAGGPPVVLVAGQTLTAQTGQRPTIAPADVQEALWWRPSVSFRDEALEDVVVAINRHSPDQLVIHDPAVARLRVTGVFRTGDAARFGRSLTQYYPVRIVRIAPGQLEIRSVK